MGLSSLTKTSQYGLQTIRLTICFESVNDLSSGLLVQTKFFSGIHHIMIHVVANGVVMPYLLDRNMETHLPVIPSEVEEVSVG